MSIYGFDLKSVFDLIYLKLHTLDRHFKVEPHPNVKRIKVWIPLIFTLFILYANLYTVIHHLSIMLKDNFLVFILLNFDPYSVPTPNDSPKY